jgi:hypothetical protein
MLDFVTFSKDGVNFSDNIFYSRVMEEMIRVNYVGDLYVRYPFNADTVATLTLMTGNTRVKEVRLDGRLLVGRKSDYDCMYTEYDLGQVEKGEHYVEFLFDYKESEYLRHVLFDDGDRDSLLNCLVYETTIEPVYLQGEFAVYDEGVVAPVGEVVGVDNLQDKGLKFFAGEVVLQGKVTLDDTACALSLEGRYMSARVYVNGAFAGTMVLDDSALDISAYTKVGENEIAISLTSSLRNMYGPHHIRGLGEKYGIIPRMFTFRGAWNGAEATLFDGTYFKPDYKYVPFGVSKILLKTVKK